MAGSRKRSLHATVQDAPEPAQERKASLAIDSPIEPEPSNSAILLKARPPALEITVTKPTTLAPPEPPVTDKSPVRYFLNTPSLPPPRQPLFIDKYVTLHFSRLKLADILDRDARSRAAFWISRALAPNPKAFLSPFEVWAVYGSSFLFYKKVDLLTKEPFIELVYNLFSSKGIQRMEAGSWKGITWKPELTEALPFDRPTERGDDMLTTKRLTVKVTYDNPEAAKPPPVYDFDDHVSRQFTISDQTVQDCVGLWHYPEPMRTQLWLEMILEEGTNEEVEEDTLWGLYGVSFNKSSKRHLDHDLFVDIVQEMFPKSDRANVAPETWVIYGIRPREKPLSLKAIDRIVKRSSRRHTKEHTIARLQRFHDRGDLVLRNTPTSALNTYQEHLLKNPLLSLPPGEISPWMQRLKTRNLERSVGGDQPGYPGQSLRELDREIGVRNYRRKVEIAKREAEKLVAREGGKADGTAS